MLIDRVHNAVAIKEIDPQMFTSSEYGNISPENIIPVNKNLPFSGLHYCDAVTLLSNGRKSLNWKKCELFTNEEVQSIADAALLLEKLFDNLNRLDAAKYAYQEFKTELESLVSNDSFAIATVDRRFRAYVFEWKLFIDHWKKYIDDGAQTKQWKNQSGVVKYISAYKKLYKDVTSSAYDNCEEYVLATAIRNHVVHANNAVYFAHIGTDGNKVSISREALLSESNISVSQRSVIKKQSELIDLSVVAEKSLKAAEMVMEELMNFQIDNENADASITLLKANARIVDAGIKADRWMIFKPTDVRWEPSPTQSVTMQRVKDEKGNPVEDPAINLPLMTQAIELTYQYLNWQSYIAFAGYLQHLYESGKWQDIKNMYLN